MKKCRFALLVAAMLAYIAFTILGYPLCGVSVMLPSILLCGFATWLYGLKTGLLIAIFSTLYNMLMMMHNTDDSQGWKAALEPGGFAAQGLAIFLAAKIQTQRRKSSELTETLEERIRQRKRDLEEINDYILNRSGHDALREKLCDIVACQLTGLLIHSESLRNFLVQAEAPQAGEAEKLVQISNQSIEQVKHLNKRLALQKITGARIGEAFEEMGAYFDDTARVHFTMAISEQVEKLPDRTALHLYRIALEVVNNALRHGKATQIDLGLEMDNGTCTLSILNNGTPLQNFDGGKGLGMRTILHRAETIRAATRFETTTDGKIRFTCTLPLDTP